MSKAAQSTRQTHEGHSTAKVALFSDYLTRYLCVLGASGGIRRAHIYDLLCGEGQYDNGQHGSALLGLRSALTYIHDYPAHMLHITYTFNDQGVSDLVPGQAKIDRVKALAAELVSEAGEPPRLRTDFQQRAYLDIIPDVIRQVRQLPRTEKALVFIDPWGYKDIRATDLQALLEHGSAEIILFLPTSHIFRFGKPLERLAEERAYQRAIKRLLVEVFPDAALRPDFNHPVPFINRLREGLQQVSGAKYSSRFVLQTASRNLFALFYFTSSLRGLEKMVEAQWKQDETTGTGFWQLRSHQTLPLYSGADQANFSAMVHEFLASTPNCTNDDLYEFTLRQGFLSRHTTEVLNRLSEQGRLVVIPNDPERPLRAGSYHLNLDSKRRKLSIALQNC